MWYFVYLNFGGIDVGKWFERAFSSATAITSKTWSWCTYVWQIFHRSHDESVLAQMLRWVATARNLSYGKSCNSSSCKSLTLCCWGKLASFFSFTRTPYCRHHKYCFGLDPIQIKPMANHEKHTIFPYFSRNARRKSQPRPKAALFAPLEYT